MQPPILLPRHCRFLIYILQSLKLHLLTQSPIIFGQVSRALFKVIFPLRIWTRWDSFQLEISNSDTTPEGDATAHPGARKSTV